MSTEKKSSALKTILIVLAVIIITGIVFAFISFVLGLKFMDNFTVKKEEKPVDKPARSVNIDPEEPALVANLANAGSTAEVMRILKSAA